MAGEINDILVSGQVKNQIKNLQHDVKTLNSKLESLQELFGNSISLGQLNLAIKNVTILINNNSGLIKRNDEKLGKISLPDTTRFYLEESEIKDFRSKSQKLVAMMADVEKLYNAMVAYLSNATSTI